MSIYANEKWTREGDTATYTYSEPGLTITETFVKFERHEERTDCYCCSCGDYGSEPYCRNHGLAGRRPCEVHEMPGEPNEDGIMPITVQAWREGRDL